MKKIFGLLRNDVNLVDIINISHLFTHRVAKTADEYFQKYYGSPRGTPSPRHRGATRRDRAASPVTPSTPLTPTTDESLLMSEERGAKSRLEQIYIIPF